MGDSTTTNDPSDEMELSNADDKVEILSLRELNYLSKRITNKYVQESNEVRGEYKHDPLGIVCNLYDIACNILLRAVPSRLDRPPLLLLDHSVANNRNVLFSTCLSIAIKSG